MRLHIISDLHLEFSEYPYAHPADHDFDVAVLAGDIRQGVQGIQWAIEHFPRHPVIYVPGNHEFYGQSSIRKALEDMKTKAQGTHIHLLDDASIVIDGVRFLGATLWTDFNLFGANEVSIRSRREAMLFLNDFSAIGRFDLREWSDRHARSRRFLREQLSVNHEGATVVVTHHAPHSGSVHQYYAGDPLTPAFVSHFPSLVGKADLWIHGHTHNVFDYYPSDCENTRVLCNPRGYAKRMNPLANETREFNPDLIVTI